ncbi:MAG TPA: hypothetical protein VGW75_07025 [Solirubrobacteraceae bacterium]|nr:hypothetical protein [Solirubrobacteraceae bacterium]
MQQRIAGSRRPVRKGRGEEPAAADVLATAAPAPRHARLALEIAQHPLDRDVVRLTHLARDLRLTDASQDAHALRRPERQIEPGHRTPAHRPLQLLTAARVAGLQ